MFSLKTAIKKILKFNKECIGSRVETRVWTNPDTNAGMGFTSLSLDLSDCDEVRIVFQFRVGDVTGQESYCKDVTLPVQYKGVIYFRSHDTGGELTEAQYSWSRKFQTSKTGIDFEASYLRLTNNATYSTSHTDFLIPLYVNKIKYVTTPPTSVN